MDLSTQSSTSPTKRAGVRWLVGELRTVRPALLAYAAVRLVGLTILALWASFAGKDPYNLLSNRWDATWYRRIAEDGYGYTVHIEDGRVHPDLAFFPLFPWLERALASSEVLDVQASGLVISWLSSLAAAWGIFHVAAFIRDRKTGVLLAALWGALPPALVQQMGYTESLFTALCAWALYAILTNRWMTAGFLAILAGLTRPSAVALVAAICVSAALYIYRERLSDDPVLNSTSTRLRGVVVGSLMAPLGWLSYVVWVGVQTDDPMGYFAVQAQWDNSVDFGRALAAHIWSLLTGDLFLIGILIVAGLGLVTWLLVNCVRQKQPLPLIVFTASILLLALIGSGYFSSRPRLMVPAFPLLLPIAVVLGRWRPARIALLMAVLAVASGAYAAGMLIYSTAPP